MTDNLDFNNIIKDLIGKHLSSLSINDSFSLLNLNEYFDKFETIIKNTSLLPISNNDYLYNSSILKKIDDSIYISYDISDELSDIGSISNIRFYYNNSDNINIINDIIEILKKEILYADESSDSETHNLNYLIPSSSGYYLSPLIIENQIDFKICYNKKTFKELKNLSKNISKKGGVWILDGENGMGKTSSLKFIAEENTNLKFIYIPNILVDNTINSLDIIEFIKNNKGAVLILDNFEKLFSQYDTRGYNTINNISMLVDSFIFNKTDIKIIIINNSNHESHYLDQLINLNNFNSIILFERLDNSNIQEISKIKKIKNIESIKNINDILNKKDLKSRKYGF
jgi:hypothetical protein